MDFRCFLRFTNQMFLIGPETKGHNLKIKLSFAEPLIKKQAQPYS